MELKENPPRRPRVIIIGAGISGLSAARRLSSAAGSALQLTVLEASHRIGGRIHTCQFSTGEQVEMGATWIHGIDGSPIYEIAHRTGALAGDVPFECMDGFPKPPIVKAQGGFTVDNAIVQPIASLYKQLIAEINDRRGAPFSDKFEDGDAANLGSFLRRRLDKYLSKQAKVPRNALAELLANHPKFCSSSWDLRSIQEGVFANQENWERCVTAAESLHDLDLPAFNEYWEFPGEQITMAKGFSSVVQALAKSLPPATIQFCKHVQKITWSEDKATPVASSGYPVQLHCEDGSVLEADHVIVTVSLGVLKAKALGTDSNGSIPDADSDSLPNGGTGGLFQPCLPAWKLDAIKKLGFGVVDKLFVLMEPLQDGCEHPNLQLVHRQSGEEDKSLKLPPRWMRKTHAMYPIHKKSNVLVAWFAGEEAKEMEALSDEEIAKGVQATLSSFGDDRLIVGLRKNLKSHIDPHVSGISNGYVTSNGTCKDSASGKDGSSSISIARGRWNQNSLFLGSYSFVAVGSSGEDIDVLAEPVPRLAKKESSIPLQLLFAGEATHREQYSTTHGAYFSGLREADRLLKHYHILD